MKVDDGLLQVVGAVVEEGQHGGPDKLGSAFGQTPGVHGFDQNLVRKSK